MTELMTLPAGISGPDTIPLPVGMQSQPPQQPQPLLVGEVLAQGTVVNTPDGPVPAIALVFSMLGQSGLRTPPVILPCSVPEKGEPDLLDGIADAIVDAGIAARELARQVVKDQEKKDEVAATAGVCSVCGTRIFGDRLEVGLCVPCESKAG